MKKLIFDIPGQLLDPLSGILFEAGAQGLQEEAGRLFAYCTDPEEESRLKEAALSFLNERAAGQEWSLNEEEVDDSWQDCWQGALDAVRLTERWVLRPTHQSPAPEDEETIWFQPQASFGDGSHPTTQLAARALCNWIHGRGTKTTSDCRIIDVGAGNGVLSLLALKEAELCNLALTRLLAIDIDEVAINSFRQNLALNQIPADRVELRLGELQEESCDFDLVVANINTPVLLDLRPQLAKVTKPGGTLLLTGLLHEDEAEVETHFAQDGLLLQERKRDDQWSLLIYERSDAER